MPTIIVRIAVPPNFGMAYCEAKLNILGVGYDLEDADPGVLYEALRVIRETLGVTDQQEILDADIASLGLDNHIVNCLKWGSRRNRLLRSPINTVGELIKRTPDELLEFKRFGRVRLDQVQAALLPLGLTLAQKKRK